MKLALAHDWFNTKFGGAERVAIELAAIWPEAPVYTMLYNPAKFSKVLPSSRIHTSYLRYLPAALKSHPRYLLPLIPSAMASLNFSGYDIVVSSSGAFMKNLTTGSSTTHICYCHSPMRFAYDYKAAYLAEQRIDPLRRAVANLLRSLIRRWDQKHTAGVDIWLANSKTVARRIARYYHKNAQIIYPPVDTARFTAQSHLPKQDYYITAASLTPYKKIDLAIAAAAKLGFKLKVIGSGSDLTRLKKMAPANVEFVGYVSESAKRRLFAQAQGLIFPNEEDFGITMVEAMAAGTPVIAFDKGGAQEIVVPNKTGVLFRDQTADGLCRAIKKASRLGFRKPALIAQSQKFDKAIFRREIKKVVKRAAGNHVDSN